MSDRLHRSIVIPHDDVNPDELHIVLGNVIRGLEDDQERRGIACDWSDFRLDAHKTQDSHADLRIQASVPVL